MKDNIDYDVTLLLDFMQFCEEIDPIWANEFKCYIEEFCNNRHIKKTHEDI